MGLLSSFRSRIREAPQFLSDYYWSKELLWNESPQCNGQKIGMFHESMSVQLFVKHVWFKTEYVIVSPGLLWNAEMHRKTPVIIKKHQSYQKCPAIDHWYVNNWRFSCLGKFMSAFSVLRLIFIPWQPLQHHGLDEFYQYVKA